MTKNPFWAGLGALALFFCLAVGTAVLVLGIIHISQEADVPLDSTAFTVAFTKEEVDTGIAYDPDSDEGMVVIVNGVEIPGLLELVLSVACEVPKE